MDSTSAVATGEGGIKGSSPQRPLVPQFCLTTNTAFGASRNDKRADNDGKRNNYV